MNGLQGIRNINAQAAKANEKLERYQAQFKGDNWFVFDAYTGGAWGKTPFQTAREAQEAVDSIEKGYGSLPDGV